MSTALTPAQAHIAWMVSVAQPAVKAANAALAGQGLGYFFGEATRTDRPFRAELAWTLRGGHRTGDTAVISTKNGRAVARLSDGHSFTLVELGALAAVDQTKLETLLRHFAAEATTHRAQAAQHRPPAVGLIRRGHGDVGGMGRGATASRGGAKT